MLQSYHTSITLKIDNNNGRLDKLHELLNYFWFLIRLFHIR